MTARCACCNGWWFSFVFSLSYTNAKYCLAPENNPWNKTGVYVPDNSLSKRPANVERTITNVFCLCTCSLAYFIYASRWKGWKILALKVQHLLQCFSLLASFSSLTFSRAQSIQFCTFTYCSKIFLEVFRTLPQNCYITQKQYWQCCSKKLLFSRTVQEVNNVSIWVVKIQNVTSTGRNFSSLLHAGLKHTWLLCWLDNYQIFWWQWEDVQN